MKGEKIHPWNGEVLNVMSSGPDAVGVGVGLRLTGLGVVGRHGDSVVVRRRGRELGLRSENTH